MKKVLFFAIPLLLIVSGALIYLRTRPKHVVVPRTSAHGQGIDREMRTLKAMLNAPEGKTACESAWNAFKAGDDAGRQPGATKFVLRLAPHDEFLARCNALPAAAQPCLAPNYSRAHRDDCVKAKPAPELLAPMFELKPPSGVSPGEVDGDRQFMSHPK